jgi:hypothetical protein
MPTFLKAMAGSASKGCLVKPIIAGFMSGDEAMGLTIRVRRPREHAPDGWFHASAHPSLPASDLAAYLRLPQVSDGRSLDYISGMSVTVGTVMGDLARQILEKKRIAIPPKGAACAACGLPQPRKCREHGAAHLPTRSRGHLDGVLNFSGAEMGGVDYLRLASQDTLSLLHGYDHKTAKTMTLKDVPDMDEAAFRQKWPKYWWQAQEYMRLTGLRRYIVLVQGLGNPWTMLEFHIPFSQEAADSIASRYAEAIRLAAAL